MPLGITSKLYVNVAPDPRFNILADTWQEIDLVADLTVEGTWNEGEASARLEQTQTFEPTNMNLMLSGRVRKEIGDLGFRTLRAAHNGRAVLDVLVLDGSIRVGGSEGYRFDAKVFQWSEDQGLQAVVFKEFSLKPCIPRFLTQNQSPGNPTNQFVRALPVVARVTGTTPGGAVPPVIEYTPIGDFFTAASAK